MREVLQTSRNHSSAASFESGCWHCHFIQKLESEPAIEWQDFHPFMRGIRASDAERLTAWAEDRPAFRSWTPACGRCGPMWINFRMQAMLMSFASYTSAPWQESGMHLARQFVDYEPGIHWSQCQMQSGAPRSTRSVSTARSSRA